MYFESSLDISFSFHNLDPDINLGGVISDHLLERFTGLFPPDIADWLDASKLGLDSEPRPDTCLRLELWQELEHFLPLVKALSAVVDVLQLEVDGILSLHDPGPVEVPVLGPLDGTKLILSDKLKREENVFSQVLVSTE